LTPKLSPDFTPQLSTLADEHFLQIGIFHSISFASTIMNKSKVPEVVIDWP
jgi:hypothetical protein